jgi:hypothetical protein
MRCLYDSGLRQSCFDENNFRLSFDRARVLNLLVSIVRPRALTLDLVSRHLLTQI